MTVVAPPTCSANSAAARLASTLATVIDLRDTMCAFSSPIGPISSTGPRGKEWPYQSAHASGPVADRGPSRHLYVVQVANRRELYEFLRTKNIFAQVHYVPVHRMPYYERLGWQAGDLPHAETYYSRCLSLPLYPTLTAAEQQYVIDCVREFVAHNPTA